jgi:hypothetical protein
MRDIAQILLVGVAILALYLVGPVGGLLLVAASNAVGVQPAAVLVLGAIALPLAMSAGRTFGGRRADSQLSAARTSSQDRKAA